AVFREHALLCGIGGAQAVLRVGRGHRPRCSRRGAGPHARQPRARAAGSRAARCPGVGSPASYRLRAGHRGARRRAPPTACDAGRGAERLQPTVILLEDLQWVDLSTLELQQLLVEQGATVPLLLLYTARPEFRPPWALRAHHTQLTLNRLGARRTREMVAHVAARGALSADVVEAVASRTGGGPPLIGELTKAALAGGARGAQEIPATLADSLMARLDRLGTAKEVAQVGAVLGREFSWALLAAVHPVPEAELAAALAKLADAELVFVRGLVPDATYAFKHALVQDAAYESLLRSRRRELHARAARVLEEKFPDVAQHQPEVLARHH